MDRDNELRKGSRLGMNGPKILNSPDNATSSTSADPDIANINDTVSAQQSTQKQSKDGVPVAKPIQQHFTDMLDHYEEKLKSAGFPFDVKRLRPDVDQVLSQNKTERLSALKNLQNYKKWLTVTLELQFWNPKSKKEDDLSTDDVRNGQIDNFDCGPSVEMDLASEDHEDDIGNEHNSSSVEMTAMDVMDFAEDSEEMGEESRYVDHYKQMVVDAIDVDSASHSVNDSFKDNDNDDESDIGDDEMAENGNEESESEFVVKKIVNGQIFMRHVTSWGNDPWYLQTNKIATCSRQPYGKQGQQAYRCHVCNACLPENKRREFHSNYAHNGGKQCDKCPYIGFTNNKFDDHIPFCDTYNSKGPRLDIGIDGNVVEGHGYMLNKVLALPLLLNGKTELWVGTTSCSTAMAGARTAVGLVENAKKHNFKQKSDIYCPSLAEMLYPNGSKALPWKPDVDNAFFFVGNFGGTEEATQHAKYFVREVYDCPSHNKPHNIRIKIQHVEKKMLQELSQQPNIPDRHMEYLRKHYLNKQK